MFFARKGNNNALLNSVQTVFSVNLQPNKQPAMRLHLNPIHKRLQEFVQALPVLFDRGEGKVLHAGRNTIRRFTQEGETLAVKRFKQPGFLQGILYAHFRRSKARRSFEHAMRLVGLGIGTPQPVAWSEYRRNGRLTNSFYISGYSELKPLSEFARRFPDVESRPALDAFARFVAELHEKGIDHRDFNQGNILCGYDPEEKQWRFELIDINLMRFLDRPLTPRQCMINLRRLSCPAPAFLYILDRYAEVRGWNIDDTLLRGLFFRLAFGRQRAFKKRFLRRKKAASA